MQTGLRISEAVALTKADLDFGRRRLAVSKRLYEGELDAPKSRHGVRQVPLSPGMAQQLWALLAKASDDVLVFTDRNGKPPDRTHLYRVVQAAGERAGIEWPVGLHALRHSCASIMFRRGVPKDRSAGYSVTTRGTSRPGRTCIWKTMTCRTVRSSEI